MTDDLAKKTEIKDQYYRASKYRDRLNECKDLKTFFDALLSYFDPGEWDTRKNKIKEAIAQKDQHDLNQSSIFETSSDRICLYLVLAELTMKDPMCGDPSQAAKLLPIMFAIGRIWHEKGNVANLDKKMIEIIRDKRNDPDGLLFEVLVALNYAKLGWQVEMLPEVPNVKTPDLYIQSADSRFFVECKRQSRQSEYSLEESITFEKMWEKVQKEASKIGLKDIWFDIVFHQELSELPDDFLKDKIFKNISSSEDFGVLVDDESVVIRFRRNDYAAIKEYTSKEKLKNDRSLLRGLIGQNWAPLNSRGTLTIDAEYSTLFWCESGTTSKYIDLFRSALGSTFKCDHPASINAKARHAKNLLKKAVQQVPTDKKSIIHLMVENAEGFAIDGLRNKKMYEMFNEFKFAQMIDTFSLNTLRCNEVTELILDIDETVQTWVVPESPVSNLPGLMVLPSNNPVFEGRHWNMRKQ